MLSLDFAMKSLSHALPVPIFNQKGNSELSHRLFECRRSYKWNLFQLRLAAPDRNRCRHGCARSRGCRKPRLRHRANDTVAALPTLGGDSVSDESGQSSGDASNASASTLASATRARSSLSVVSAVAELKGYRRRRMLNGPLIFRSIEYPEPL